MKTSISHLINLFNTGLTIAEKLNIKNEMLYRDVSTLSGGERKRIGLSAALLKQPGYLLLYYYQPLNKLYC
jgi:ABC-type dipeptide/oligopeptide/nickel transport system ATPase subunit